MRERLRRVNAHTRCPVCHKDSWCLLGADVGLCMRVQSDRVVRFKDGSEGWIHRLNGEVKQLPPPRKEPPILLDISSLIETWQKGTSPYMLKQCAQELGVSPLSLLRLNACWAHRYRAWAFPMRDGSDGLIGLRLRRGDGFKFAVPGSHNGLFIPGGLEYRTIFVLEGPTDTAAALTLGLDAIGRPSCSGGVDHLVRFFREKRVSRAVIVADNDNPGLRGADTLAIHAPCPTATLVLPTKDIRRFLQEGGTKELIMCLLHNTIWRVPYDTRAVEKQVPLCQ